VNTIAWLLILIGILTARQVTRGRVMSLPKDLGDAFIAVASGDTDSLGEILTRKGDADTPTAADLAIYNLTEATTTAATDATSYVAGGIGDAWKQLEEGIANIAAAAMIMGERAKGYRWTATGPEYYDCSGLMWRACQAIGFKGSRFTTASLPSLKEFKRIDPKSAAFNDIVLWLPGSGGVTGHMGVKTDTDQFYSARSVRSGIGASAISTFRKTTPRYYRYVGPHASVDPFKNSSFDPFKK
jgi:cell wall-associated NlpC family hydrolase